MDSMRAFEMNEAAQATGAPYRVFDWDKAARIIRDRGVRDADAGLASDYEWTRGTILRDGKPVTRDDSYTYLASTWATPMLIIGDEEIECARIQDGSGWEADTSWPASARAIIDSPASPPAEPGDGGKRGD